MDARQKFPSVFVREEGENPDNLTFEKWERIEDTPKSLFCINASWL